MRFFCVIFFGSKNCGRGILLTNSMFVNIKKENSHPCKKTKQINNKVSNKYKIKIYRLSIFEKLTVLAPWTRQAEMTVATMEAISMITPKMKIPGGRHHQHYHHNRRHQHHRH